MTTLTNDQITAGAAVLDLRHEFEMYKSNRGEAVLYEGDGHYCVHGVNEQFEAFIAGAAVAQRAPSPQVADIAELPPLKPMPKPHMRLSEAEGSEDYPVFLTAHMQSYAREYARDAIAASRRASVETALAQAVLGLDKAIHQVLIAGGDYGDELSDQGLRDTLKQAQVAAYPALISAGVEKTDYSVNPLSTYVNRATPAPASAGQAECCGNPSQCWEPCGNLGKDAQHAVVVSARQAAPIGSWLWCKLMDWCKNRGVAPSNYDDLFAIAGEAHKLAAQPAEGAGQAGQVAKAAHPNSGICAKCGELRKVHTGTCAMMCRTGGDGQTFEPVAERAAAPAELTSAQVKP